MNVNNVMVTPVGNYVTDTPIRNIIEASVFSVTSAYYLLSQFQPYRHDTKVGAEE